MTAENDRERLAELQREFGRYCGDALTRTTGDVYAMRRIAREIEVLVRKRDNPKTTDQSSKGNEK